MIMLQCMGRLRPHGHQSKLDGLQGSMESMYLSSYTRSMGDNSYPCGLARASAQKQASQLSENGPPRKGDVRLHQVMT